MRIVGPIQFWSSLFLGLYSRPLIRTKKVDSVHSKIQTRFTPEHIPVFRALLEIKIETEIKIKTEIKTEIVIKGGGG